MWDKSFGVKIRHHFDSWNTTFLIPVWNEPSAGQFLSFHSPPWCFRIQAVADIRQSPSNIHKLWAKCFFPPPPYILSQCLYKTVPDWHVEINYLKLQYYYRCICHILYLIAFRNVGSAVCQTTYWTHLHGVPQLVFRDWHNVGTTSFL